MDSGLLSKDVDQHPLIAALQHANRSRASIKAMSDNAFDQFVQMLRNYRKCDVFHDMDFARQNWGTKWNAYSQSVDLAAGNAKFDTAWSFAKPVFEALSKRLLESLYKFLASCQSKPLQKPAAGATAGRSNASSKTSVSAKPNASLREFLRKKLTSSAGVGTWRSTR